jgi:hypothetical protein
MESVTVLNILRHVNVIFRFIAILLKQYLQFSSPHEHYMSFHLIFPDLIIQQNTVEESTKNQMIRSFLCLHKGSELRNCLIRPIWRSWIQLSSYQISPTYAGGHISYSLITTKEYLIHFHPGL